MLEFMKFWAKEEEQDIQQIEKHPVRSFSAPDNVDGAKEIHTNLLAPQLGHAAIPTDAQGEGAIPTKELIKGYRALAEYHEVDDAIQEIVDEAIVYENDKEVVWLNLDNTDFSESIKAKINEEFDRVVSLLQMRKHGYKLFRKWYVDSRIYFHKILDKENNIIELRPLDPMKMELVREIQKETVEGVEVVNGTLEYYVYKQSDYKMPSWMSATNRAQTSFRIPKEAIVFAHSGLMRGCADEPYIIGYLDRAIKPANQLKMLEDALVIYRLARAPERRVFYVDVGNLPTQKAQQYVNGIMQNVKNRIVYDTSTGKVKNTTNAMSMLEDYYLPRREGSKGTEVSTLPGGQSLGDIEDVLYFNRKLYKAMRIPTSRAASEDQGGGINFGQGAEISRDELKFTKFVKRLQTKFETVITDPLKHQLIVNNIITEEEWDSNHEKIYVVFNQDSYFEESKELEILNSRMNAMRDLQEYAGKYYSHKYIQKNILRLSDDQITAMQSEIDEEETNPRFQQDDQGF
ncbi:portal vertex protein of head [Vibrio phage nt-1]|uniref:Portal protein n=1 Tax=Vibrio phage nt-1 TaxID=115992 RepID=R9TE75_9CAUD|nr:portal protein [Vibrio phage nt-1]AGN30031.1 portal vertex protein of head [Vibrio phage nt-1]